jgi:hypothetical protein
MARHPMEDALARAEASLAERKRAQRLADAAPDLLTALKAVLTVWHDATATRIDDEAAETAARAAIAKAESS